MTPYWPSLTILPPGGVDRARWEVFCALAMEAGAAGFEEEPATGEGVPERARFGFEVGESSDVRAYPALEAVAELARRTLGEAGLVLTPAVEPAVDWVARWREWFHAALVTPTLWVGPPEERETAPQGALYVAIEPGSAFGTGTHATTRACLVLLERLVRRTGPVRCVLDAGTGSGILCAAARLLGCEQAIGFERDPLAEDNFRLTMELNGCAAGVLFVPADDVARARACWEAAGWPGPELVLCNMLSSEFDGLLGALRLLERPLLLSGFLCEESAAVAARLAETGWRVVERLELDGWEAWRAEPA
jgi:ribosomal protein L11 methylase PrmA